MDCPSFSIFGDRSVYQLECVVSVGKIVYRKIYTLPLNIESDATDESGYQHPFI